MRQRLRLYPDELVDSNVDNVFHRQKHSSEVWRMVHRRGSEDQRADSAVHHLETHRIPGQPGLQVVQEEGKQMAGMEFYNQLLLCRGANLFITFRCLLVNGSIHTEGVRLSPCP